MGNYLPCCRNDHKDEKREFQHTLSKSPFPKVEKGEKCDLHYLTKDEALQKVKNVIRKKEEEVWLASQDSTVEFITGRGKHSRNHYPVLRKAVTNYLDEHDFEWNYTDRFKGSVIVQIPYQV